MIYYSEEDTVTEFLHRVHEILQYDAPDIDVALLTSWDFIKERIYLSVQKLSENEDVLVKPFLNLEAVLRISLDLGIDGEGTVRVTKGLAEKLGVTEDVLWSAAAQHTRDSTSVRRLSEIIGIDDGDNEGGLYVVSAQLGGAGVLYLSDIFADFCKEHDQMDCYILPSSVEEVIVLFGSEVRNRMSVHELAKMVELINLEQVDPIMQLEPVVYHFRLSDGSIRVAARA